MSYNYQLVCYNNHVPISYCFQPWNLGSMLEITCHANLCTSLKSTDPELCHSLCLQDMTIYWTKTAFFRHFYITQSRLKPLKEEFFWDLWYESWCKKTGLSDSENHMILWSLVLSQYQRVTDRQTDRRTRHLHRVSKITVHFCFCQNFIKFTPTLNISFGRQMAKWINCMLCKYFPPNLTHVTALPCEKQMFSIVT